MIKVILTLFVFLCSGCAGIVIPLDKPDVTSTDAIQFEFVDLRPDGEKVLRHASEGQLFHAYGDKEFEPDRVKMLKNALVARCGKKLVGHRVEITRFEFIAYIPGLLERQKKVGKGSAWGGLIGGLAAAASRKPDAGDRYICTLEGTVDSKPIAVDDYEKIPGYIDLSPAKKAGNKLMQRILQAFATKVNTAL